MAAGRNWCKQGLDQDTCHRYHSWGQLPAGPGRGKDRECPVCRSNLSISKGDRGMWVIWTCHGGCDRGVVRDALEKVIDPLCLGAYASPDWEDRQQRRGGGNASFPARTDPATFAAAGRSYAYQKLIGAELVNVSLLRMCMQAISESTDGNVAGDPDQLLPRDYKEFTGLARRTGIERCYAAKLARSYLTKSVADLNP